MSDGTTGGSARRAVAARMADEAQAFLASLDDTQRAAAQWPWPSDDERHRWYYTPTDHGGLPLSAMTLAQHRLAHRLLASGLSRAGYVTAATIIGLDNVLDELEGWTIGFGRERGRDPLAYYVRVFGEPGGDAPWSWRVGGHHLSVNFTIVGGELLGSTPCFMGADPASSPLLGPHPLRPLAGVEDLGRELVRSLDDAQRAVAIVSSRAPTDIVGGNRPRLIDGLDSPRLPDIWRGHFDGDVGQFLNEAQRRMESVAALSPNDVDAFRYTSTPKGLAARALRADQRDMLDALLRLYVGRLPDAVADEELARFSGNGLGELYVLWAGGLEPGQPHYYRVHGPTLVVEYDNSARGANHVHSVWRDPRGDFGDDVLARHLADHHH
jgi:Protein of unknown function (DUF3500)